MDKQLEIGDNNKLWDELMRLPVIKLPVLESDEQMIHYRIMEIFLGYEKYVLSKDTYKSAFNEVKVLLKLNENRLFRIEQVLGKRIELIEANKPEPEELPPRREFHREY